MSPLIPFFNNFLANPNYYIGCLMSAFAVLAFLVALRGFIASVGYVFGDDGHIEHQEHAYTRVVWGTILLLVVFIVWEITRIFGLFGLLLLFFVWATVSLLFGEKSKGGAH